MPPKKFRQCLPSSYIFLGSKHPGHLVAVSCTDGTPPDNMFMLRTCFHSGPQTSGDSECTAPGHVEDMGASPRCLLSRDGIRATGFRHPSVQRVALGLSYSHHLLLLSGGPAAARIWLRPPSCPIHYVLAQRAPAKMEALLPTVFFWLAARPGMVDQSWSPAIAPGQPLSPACEAQVSSGRRCARRMQPASVRCTCVLCEGERDAG